MQVNENGELLVTPEEDKIIKFIVENEVKRATSMQEQDDEDIFGSNIPTRATLENEHDHKSWIGTHDTKPTYTRANDFLAKDFKFGRLENSKVAFIMQGYWECAEEYFELGYPDIAEIAHSQLQMKNDTKLSVLGFGIRSQMGALQPKQEEFIQENTRIQQQDNENPEKKEGFFDRWKK